MAPLHYAASQGEIKCLKELLLRGADIDARDDSGSTPLHWAREKVECMKELLLRGADIETKNNDGLTPLDAATKFGETECVRELQR